MNPTTGQLFQAGLVITALGMGLVFAALALLWGLLRLLTVVLADEPAPHKPAPVTDTGGAERQAAAADGATVLTAERARVAAIAASLLLANVQPLRGLTPRRPVAQASRGALMIAPAGPPRVVSAWGPRSNAHATPQQPRR